MKLIKNGEVINLNNQGHIDAYMENGWAAYTEPSTATSEAKPKRATAKKIK